MEALLDVARQVREGHISAVDLTTRALDRIASLDGEIKAFEMVFSDTALADAREADREIQLGRYRGMLHGIPIAIKDTYDIKGRPTRSGSQLRQQYLATRSASVVVKLRRAGAIIVGKTRTHELGFGLTTPPTRNPWNTGHIPGGSSGGSAAAVAAGLVFLATGGDTGGSIRGPASLCGVVGIKPTYGLVSRFGITANSWSLDTAGAIGHRIADVAVALSAIAGHDRADPSTIRIPKLNYLAAMSGGVRGLRIGLPSNYFFDDVQPEVRDGVLSAAKALEQRGAEIRPFSLPLARFYPATLLAIQSAEISNYHRYGLKQSPELIGESIRLVLGAGSLVPASYYITALRVRTLVRREWHGVLSQVDLVLAPTHPITATQVGDESSVTWEDGKRETFWRVYSRLLTPANLTGLPAVSVPCGLDSRGLPFGLQLIGRPFEEATIMRAAAAWEEARAADAAESEPPVAAAGSWLH